MIINEYVKRWCDEDYDVRQEDFYVENAYYVSEKQWSIGGLKHGLIALIVSVSAFFLNQNGLMDAFITSISLLAAFTACFYIYGMKEYDAHNVVSYPYYIVIMLFFIISFTILPNFVNCIFGLLMLPVFVYSSIIRPLNFIKTKKQMKEKVENIEKEFEEQAKQHYGQWKREYEEYRYGLPKAETSETDPMMEEARRLFVGYTSDAAMLKSRYRQLAKQHHPDRGGNEQLMKCIIAVYEDMKQAYA